MDIVFNKVSDKIKIDKNTIRHVYNYSLLNAYSFT